MKTYCETEEEELAGDHCAKKQEAGLPGDDIFNYEHQLAAIAGTETDDKPSARGCVNFAIYGNCFRGVDCKNAGGHNENVAKETRQWLMKKLATVERDGYSTSVPKKDQTRT